MVMRVYGGNVQNTALTALSHVMAVTEMSEQDVRGLLGGLGLQGPVVSERSLAALSGGQMVRVAFALVVWRAPHVLVLDEVTTHVDSPTILALAIALRAYEGAIVVVSHDRWFVRVLVEGERLSRVRRVAVQDDPGAVEDDDEVSDDDEDDTLRKPGRVFQMTRKGVLKRLEGGMDEYEEIATRLADKLVKGKV